MSMELIALMGIGVTIISVGIALAALILTTQRNLRTDMQAQREIIISLLERMAHLEGLLEGLREAITGRRVAEDAGKYERR